MSVQPPSSVLGARYAGVAQHALADAADLLGDLLGGGVVGGGAQFDALELLVAEEPLGDGERRLGGIPLAARPGGDDVGELGGQRMRQLVLRSWTTPTRRWVRNSVTARSSPRPAVRSAGAYSVIQVRASSSV